MRLLMTRKRVGTKVGTKATLALTALLAGAALAGPTFTIDWHSIDAGGGVSASASYTLEGSIGQPDAGTMSSDTWSLAGGVVPGGPPTAPPCPSDLDHSGETGFGDLLIVLAAWGPCGVPCLEDIDGSGDVGFGDLIIVLSSWGACPE